MKSLSNTHIELVIDPRRARWSVYDRKDGASIEGARLAVSFRRSGRLHSLDLELMPARQAQMEADPNSQRARLIAGSPQMGLGFHAEWQLQGDGPILRWRVTVTNQGANPIALESIECLSAGPIAYDRWARFRGKIPFLPAPIARDTGTVRPDPSPGEMFFYTNGWQSWSFAGSLRSSQRQPRTRMGPLTRPILENPSTPRARGDGHFSSDMFAVLGNRETGKAILLGALSEKQAFTSVEARTDRFLPALSLMSHGDRVQLGPGASFQTDWMALLFLDVAGPDPLGEYLREVASENNARVAARAPVGWSSWYYHYGTLSAEDISSTIDWISQNQSLAPLDLIQIDDGYQREVGDWLMPANGFPQGPALLAEQAAGAGLLPGIWVAPLVAKPRSNLVRARPELVLRRGSGTPSNAGYNWDSFVVGLDPSNPDSLEEIRKVIHTAVHEWGYQYLKLDFLYAGALRGRRENRSTTRAQALRAAYRTIREAAGEDVFLLACGSPIGPAIGIFDGMRVGPDVAPRWTPSYRGIETWFGKEPSLPSVKNAVRNSLTRSFMHRDWWLNDPDCLILREDDTHLSEDEVITLATVASLSGGLLIDSDDLPHLPEERLSLLRSLLPPLVGKPQVPDLFRKTYPELILMEQQGLPGDWWLLARINWSDTFQDITWDLGWLSGDNDRELHGVDFWRGEYVRTDGRMLERTIPPHGTCLLGLRPLTAKSPAWIGDTLHISQGATTAVWKIGEHGLEARLQLHRKTSGSIWLALPREPKSASANERPLLWSQVSPGVYRFDLNVEYGPVLSVDFG